MLLVLLKLLLGPAHLLLIAFSVKTNSEKLLSISKNPDMLPCLHGIRFISMMWVLLGHKYYTTAIRPLINLFDVFSVCIQLIRMTVS